MAHGGDHGNQHTVAKGQNYPLPENPALSIEQAAELMNVSPKSVKNAKATKRPLL